MIGKTLAVKVLMMMGKSYISKSLWKDFQNLVGEYHIITTFYIFSPPIRFLWRVGLRGRWDKTVVKLLSPLFLIPPIRIAQMWLYLNFFQYLPLVYIYRNYLDFEEHI